MQIEPVVPSSIKPEPAPAEEPNFLIEDVVSEDTSVVEEAAPAQKMASEQESVQVIPGSVTSKSTPEEELDSIIESLASDEEPVIDEMVSDQEAVPVKKPSTTTYGPVKKGDTLSKIALEETSYHLQLNQILVALHRANREAFSGNNMNRLNIGSILRIPDANEVATISPDVADKEVKMQTANWEAYRQKLAADVASSVPVSEESTQTVTGKITTTIQSNATVAKDPSKGVLKLSKGGELEKSGSEDTVGVQNKIYSLEENAVASEKMLIEANKRISLLENAMKEDAIAQEKALIEANERIKVLEKNIKELRRLLELKNPNLAKAQGQADQITTSDAAIKLPLPQTTNKSAQIETPSEIEVDQDSIKWQWWLLAIFLLFIVLWGWKYWNTNKKQTSEFTDTY
jgi:pilus assembly protein FimV